MSQAVFSGQLGQALMVDDAGQCFRLSLDQPSLVPCSPSAYRMLLGHAEDLQVLEKTNEIEVRKLLEQAQRNERALRLAHFLMDVDLGEELRAEIAAELEGYASELAFVRNTFYLCPAPEEADLIGAITASAKTPQVQALYRDLSRDQPLIQRMWDAWQTTDAYQNEDPQTRNKSLRDARDAGWFSLLAGILASQKNPANLLFGISNRSTVARLNNWIHQLHGTGQSSKPTIEREAKETKSKKKPAKIVKHQGKR